MSRATPLPRLLVVSHVLPFPAVAGQNQRVRYTLEAARRRFHVTFLTYADPSDVASTSDRLRLECDEAIVLPSLHAGSAPLARACMTGIAHLKAWCGCLKPSNHLIGDMELSRSRVLPVVAGGNFDLVLFEYWHAWRAATACRHLGTMTVVDTHNVLWHTYGQYIDARRTYPTPLRAAAVRRYRSHEERAWAAFDVLIAINKSELAHLRTVAGPSCNVLYAPMGISMEKWPYSYDPATPPRVAYYGGLGSARNSKAALACHREVMPVVWSRRPDAEYWIIGSNPPQALRDLEADVRVKVTGFVEQPPELLGSMSVVLCPWQGTYGFRSRVVEVLAAGAPMVAFRDAVDGMDFSDGEGIVLVDDLRGMTAQVLALLSEPERAAAQSRAGRSQAVAVYDAGATYGAMVEQLATWAVARSGGMRGMP
jgi:glycosyltransferase involved in cell wall biosynthesis